MNNLKVKNLGPIGEADIKFGDLTILVGPQATGKSLLLQALVFVCYPEFIRSNLEYYSYAWSENPDSNLNLFFGPEMAQIWKESTTITIDGEPKLKTHLTGSVGKWDKPQVAPFSYIPAQRVLCIAEGRPRVFTEWEDAPYVLRRFGEFLKQYIDNLIDIDSTQGLTHLADVARPVLDNAFDDTIFHGGKVLQVNENGKRRLKLFLDRDTSIPFIAMSTGQKEFTPLNFAMRYLLLEKSPRGSQHDKLVIIEEPEMGLHPAAIVAVMFNIMLLVAHGYKVVISTHSPVVLELAWAIRHIVEGNGTVNDLMELFEGIQVDGLESEFEAFLKKGIKTFYFDNQNGKVSVKDISGLDAASEDLMEAEWGGLTSFAGKAGEVVAKVMSNVD